MASMSCTDNINVNEKIEALWVMGGASVLKDYSTKEIVGYSCYCDICKKKSVSGDGGIAFNTAEDLLEHRKMKAFICPCGCGFHICEEFGSIVRHLDSFHKEVLVKLQKEGLNLEERKKVWIYPDQAENTYTLTKPMPIVDASPLETAAVILAMTPPKRVEVAPAAWGAKKKGKFIPLDLNNPVPPKKESAPTAVVTGQPKQWASIKKEVKSLSTVMEEEMAVKEIKKEVQQDDSIWGLVHYAQFDMRKEKQCPEGQKCVKKDRPFACPLNHDGNGDIIKRGTVLSTNIICPYERPGPGTTGMRCGDGRCTQIHLERRAEFIEKKKKMFFENDSQVKPGVPVGTIVGELSKKKVSARITMTMSGGTIEMSEEDIMAVAATGPDAFDIEAQKKALDNFEFDKPRPAFAEAAASAAQSDETNEEDDEADVSDIKVFAHRKKTLIRNAEN